MSAEPGKVAAELAAIWERIRSARIGIPAARVRLAIEDAPRLLVGYDELLKVASGWIANSPAQPVLDREAAGLAIQSAISRALLGEDTADGS